jgi:D-serine deaminase-like pyridoxal phosphate-dependent protein
MTESPQATPNRPLSVAPVGPWTKGLALDGPSSLRDVAAPHPTVTADTFSWPLLTLDDAALEHNLATMAGVCRAAGVQHAPHVKTTMSPQLFARQLAHGAWGATVANPAQLRTVVGWGARRVFLANELVDPREAAWLRRRLETEVESGAGAGAGAGAGEQPLEVWTYVDSTVGLRTLADAFADADPQVRGLLGVLVELGVAAGRTGVRTPEQALALARGVDAAGLRLVGVAGYEGSAAGGTTPEDLARVAAFCRALREVAGLLAAERLVGRDGAPVVVSAGGSSFLDVVLAELPGDLTRPDGAQVPVDVVVRSGAYVTHDHGFCERMDPWRRIPGGQPLRAAAVVWAQVLSAPEPGLVILGAGRRDLAYDLDLPVALSVRRADAQGRLSPPVPLDGTTVTALNDQHLFLAMPAVGTTADAQPGLAPGDVVGLGISHPCTLFDKWRVASVVDADDHVVELVTTDF